MKINGTQIAYHNFGYVSGTNPETATLTGTFQAPTTGLYTLEIKNTRGTTKTSLLTNYLDTVVLKPTDWMLGSDGVTFCCLKTSTRTFILHGGTANAGLPFWMWVGISGTYPGLQVGGVEVPLNPDILVDMCWNYPGFPGVNFYGTLDGNGEATASLTVGPNMSYKGLTLYFVYVILSPGGGLPLVAASNPVNATFVLFE